MTSAALFARCGQFLCGTGPKWKEQFAAMLQVKTNTVDNLAKGDSRVPPGMWREIAAFIQDRESEAPKLRASVLAAADAATAPTSHRGDGMQTAVTSGPGSFGTSNAKGMFRQDSSWGPNVIIRGTTPDEVDRKLAQWKADNPHRQITFDAGAARDGNAWSRQIEYEE
jgi:hypothetical protein